MFMFKATATVTDTATPTAYLSKHSDPWVAGRDLRKYWVNLAPGIYIYSGLWTKKTWRNLSNQIFNQNLLKKKSYYMNFTLKYKLKRHITLIFKFKVRVV